MIPEMSHPTSSCLHPEKWHAHDDMATEVELISFLTALVIALKPHFVVETGCYLGHGSEALARGLCANGEGFLYTCDMGSRECDATRARLQTIPFDSAVVFQSSGVDMIKQLPDPIDFAFLDSGMDTPRIDELKALYPKLSPGAVVAIHDSGPQFGMREFYLGKTLRELNMQHIYFDTPRGMALCRKMPEVYP